MTVANAKKFTDYEIIFLYLAVITTLKQNRYMGISKLQEWQKDLIASPETFRELTQWCQGKRK